MYEHLEEFTILILLISIFIYEKSKSSILDYNNNDLPF